MTTSLFSTTMIILLSVFLVSACGPSEEQEKPVAVASPAEPDMTAVMGKWTRSCALCHINGIGGAPRTGAKEEWEPRLAQGKATLLRHTLEGYNNMPPLGYCMACEEEDFVALIDFMLGETP